LGWLTSELAHLQPAAVYKRHKRDLLDVQALLGGIQQKPHVVHAHLWSADAQLLLRRNQRSKSEIYTNAYVFLECLALAAASETVSSRKLLTIGPDDFAAAEAIGQAGAALVSKNAILFAGCAATPS
jgi:hypothetical protein